MKFCKNLQRVVDISDPEWAPFWPNYKMLKKLIVNPSDGNNTIASSDTEEQNPKNESKACKQQPSKEQNSNEEKKEEIQSNDQESNDNPASSSSSQLHKLIQNESFFQTRAEVVASLSVSKTTSKTEEEPPNKNKAAIQKMEKNPSEVTFFKHIHIEFRKVIHFFAKTQEEFKIREERIRLGIDIMTKYDRTMASDRWSSSAKSLYRLYKDLLLLETYAIMSYCSFSKILKKHDKVTGHSTRNAYMSNIVSKANFSTYPNLIKMIGRCEDLYEQVSNYLAAEGRKYSLQDDERLFINTIHKLNEQVIVSTNDEDGHLDDISERRDKSKLTSLVSSISSRRHSSSLSSFESCSDYNKEEKSITESLKEVAREDENKATIVAKEDDDSDSTVEKRKVCYHSDDEVGNKRLCTK